MESKTFTVGAPEMQLTIYLSTADPAEEFQPSVKHYHSPQTPNPTLVSKEQVIKIMVVDLRARFYSFCENYDRDRLVWLYEIGRLVWGQTKLVERKYFYSMPQLFRLFVRRVLARKSKRKGRRHVDQHAGRACSRSHVWHWCDWNHCKLTLMWGNIPLNSHRLTW